MYVCVPGGKKCLFFGNFGVLCFLKTPVLRFALLQTVYLKDHLICVKVMTHTSPEPPMELME